MSVVTPANEMVSAGSNVYYTATATLFDSTQIDVTNLVLWTSSGRDVAPVSNWPRKGKATALEPGTTTISARLGALSAETSLTVTPTCDEDFLDDHEDFALESVFIVGPITLRVGEKVQAQVIGVYEEDDNGDTVPDCFQDLSDDHDVEWDSDDEDVFKIGHPKGKITGIGPGMAEVDVEYHGREDSAIVTVLP